MRGDTNMKKSLGVCFLLAAVLAGPVFAQKWIDLSEDEVQKIIERRNPDEIVKIQKNSAKPEGECADERESYILGKLIQAKDYELLKLLLQNGRMRISTVPY
jgi:hypothetical protein